ncbi:hypothetical protein [Janibacter sp. G368]|uniref:hypothetical protein n=1 Tax=Janibacter sp. G368 TaxID=3420441 RepID=UPI003D05945B
MTLAMDARLVSTKARVGFVFGRIGMVPEDLLPSARALADRWTKGRSPVAVALARQMLRRNAAQEHPVEAHRVDSLAMWHTSVGDGKEGVAAFLDQRHPDFTSRASQMPDLYGEWIGEA